MQRAHYPLLVTGPFSTFLYSRQHSALPAQQDGREMCAKGEKKKKKLLSLKCPLNSTFGQGTVFRCKVQEQVTGEGKASENKGSRLWRPSRYVMDFRVCNGHFTGNCF